jgi:hypothetical protein
VKLDCKPYDWLVSLRVAEQTVLVFSIAQTTEPVARAKVLHSALRYASGQEIFIEMTGFDHHSPPLGDNG